MPLAQLTRLSTKTNCTKKECTRRINGTIKRSQKSIGADFNRKHTLQHSILSKISS
jgi:hypothetical protein